MRRIVFYVVSLIFCFGFGFYCAGNLLHKRYQEAMRMSNKHLDLFMLCNKWIKLNQSNTKLEEFFTLKGYRRIAIYGLGYLGESLNRELKNSTIDVVCAIDRDAESIYSGLTVHLPDESIPEVDAIIVTAISAFDQVERTLSEKVNCDIVSLEDVIDCLLG